MTDASKKTAAALAAVNAYLEEEEALSQQSRDRQAPTPPPQSVSPWGLAGRQDMMSMRQLIQLKAFSRF